MNENYQAGKEAALCRGQGLPVIIMEPLLGGLARTGPELQKIWDGAPVQRTGGMGPALAVEPAGSDLVLSGMSAMEHVEENPHRRRSPGQFLTDEELAVIERVKEFYLARTGGLHWLRLLR